MQMEQRWLLGLQPSQKEGLSLRLGYVVVAAVALACHVVVTQYYTMHCTIRDTELFKHCMYTTHIYGGLCVAREQHVGELSSCRRSCDLPVHFEGYVSMTICSRYGDLSGSFDKRASMRSDKTISHGHACPWHWLQAACMNHNTSLHCSARLASMLMRACYSDCSCPAKLES
jgi:hypothetical protein